MNRRSFLTTLAALPFVGKLFARKESREQRVWFSKVGDPAKAPEGNIITFTPDLCPLCKTNLSAFPATVGSLAWEGSPFGIESCHCISMNPNTPKLLRMWTSAPGREIPDKTYYISQLRRRREMELDIQSEAFLRKPISAIHLTAQKDDFNRAAHKVPQIDAMIHRVKEAMK